jgi:hypothetical protein
MADVYPAAAQRQALLALMPALGCSDMTLRRDECGDWRILGKHGHVFRSRAQLAALSSAHDQAGHL